MYLYMELFSRLLIFVNRQKILLRRIFANSIFVNPLWGSGLPLHVQGDKLTMALRVYVESCVRGDEGPEGRGGQLVYQARV